MSKFNIGDMVKCIDQNSKYYRDIGDVDHTVTGMCRVNFRFANKNVPMYDDQLEMHVPAIPSMFSIGDRVEYFDKANNSTIEGTVTQIHNHNQTLSIIFDGDVLTSLMTMQSVRKIITAPTTIGSHYQPVIEEDPHTRIADEEDNNPFEHTNLGSDLSGDELMDSIRSICGR